MTIYLDDENSVFTWAAPMYKLQRTSGGPNQQVAHLLSGGPTVRLRNSVLYWSIGNTPTNSSPDGCIVVYLSSLTLEFNHCIWSIIDGSLIYQLEFRTGLLRKSRRLLKMPTTKDWQFNPRTLTFPPWTFHSFWNAKDPAKSFYKANLISSDYLPNSFPSR